MGKLAFSILGFIAVSYFAFIASIYSLNDEAKFVKLSDLKHGEDWVMLIWLFGVPLIVEIIIIGVPIFYGLHKSSLSQNLLLLCLSFALSFAFDFLFTKSLY